GVFAREFPFESGDVVQCLIDFALIRAAVEDERICGFYARGGAQFFPVEKRFRDLLRAFVQEFAVEPEERLRGDVGQLALARSRRRIAEIEEVEQRRQVRAPQRQVNRASLQLFGIEAQASLVVLSVSASSGLERAAHRQVERSVNRQQPV